MSIVRALGFSLFLTMTLAAARGEDKAAGDVARELTPAEPAHASSGIENSAPRFIQVDTTVNEPAADLTDRDAQTDPDITEAGEKDMVAAFADTGSSANIGNHGVGYAWSNNYGRSWNDAGVLPASVLGDGGKPSVAYHRSSGVVFLAARSAEGSILQLFRSIDRGRSFRAPVNASPGVPSAYKLDSPRIAVDNVPGDGNGHIYVCVSASDQAHPSPTSILFTRSATGGTAFAPSGGLTLGSGTNCHVTVSPNHQVNILYTRVGPAGRSEIFMRRSINKGGSFLQEVRVAELNSSEVAGRIAPEAAVVVAPILGSSPPRYPIFVVYSDVNPAAPDGKRDVFYVASLDNGATWSAPVQYNDVAAGDQDCASIAALEYANGPLMLGFCSKNQVWDGAFNVHQRGRLATVNTSGTIARFMPSFQIGPNTPNSMGLSIRGLSRFFVPVWADDRSGNDFHERQFDIRFGRISLPLPTADLSLDVLAPARLSLGRRATVTLTAAATNGSARDVFVKIPRIDGLAITQIRAADGKCSLREGTADCALDEIPAGSSKSIEVEVIATNSAAVRSFVANATTTSLESNTSNNSVARSVSVVNDGSAILGTYATGPIGITVWGGSSKNFPVSVPAGSVAGISVRINLAVSNFDTNVVHFSLVAPNGRSIPLMPSPNYSAWIEYYGSGSGDSSCSGGLEFTDAAARSIYEVEYEQALTGSIRPGQSLMGAFTGASTAGSWKLSVSAAESLSSFYQHYATVYCFAVTILRGP